MRASGLQSLVALPVLAVAPGRASAPVHLVADPPRWDPGYGGPLILAFSAAWWPPSHSLPKEARGVLLHGTPPTAEPTPSVPVVAGVDADILREREAVELDGTLGTLTIPGVEEVRVVTAFLERPDGRILLLERSRQVGSFQGRWAGVSGFLEDPTPLDQAYREVREEVGLAREALELRTAGTPVLARDGARIFVVYPFRFRVHDVEIRLDWEHVRAEWVDPSEIRRRPTVPKLDRVWETLSRPDPRKT